MIELKSDRFGMEILIVMKRSELYFLLKSDRFGMEILLMFCNVVNEVFG